MLGNSRGNHLLSTAEASPTGTWYSPRSSHLRALPESTKLLFMPSSLVVIPLVLDLIIVIHMGKLCLDHVILRWLQLLCEHTEQGRRAHPVPQTSYAQWFPDALHLNHRENLSKMKILGSTQCLLQQCFLVWDSGVCTGDFLRSSYNKAAVLMRIKKKGVENLWSQVSS